MFGPKMEVEFKSKGGEVLNLILCPPRDEREVAQKFNEWINDNRVRQYLGLWAGVTESYEAEWFRSQANKKDEISWTIYVGDTLVGNLGIHAINLNYRQAELGIVLGNKEFWGKGIATVCEIAVLDFAFNNVVAGGLNKISARAYEGNIASQKALERAGLRTVGILGEEVWKNGRWYDAWLGEVLQSEWITHREDIIKKANVIRLDLYPGCEDLP